MTDERDEDDAAVAASMDSLEAYDIDEYQLLVHPIVVGGGKRLFGNGTDRKPLGLVETKAFASGVVVLRYERE